MKYTLRVVIAAVSSALLLLLVACNGNGATTGTPQTPVEVSPGIPSPLPTSEPVSTTPPPDLPAGKIAFVSSRDGNDEIYVMNSDGSDQINVTNDQGQDIDPDWSPDASKILFASDRDGELEIYVAAADGSDVERLTDNPAQDSSPKWSPDGKQIAFRSFRGDTTLWVMDADGGNPHAVIDEEDAAEEPLCASGGFPGGWSGDGSRINFWVARVAEAEADEPADVIGQVCSVASDGSDLRVLAIQPPGFDVQSDVSPNGESVVFRSQRDGNDEIYVMGSDGVNQTRLTDNPFPDVQPRWSPGGDWIVFASSREGNFEIYVMRMDGTGLTRLTEAPAADNLPDWNPDSAPAPPSEQGS